VQTAALPHEIHVYSVKAITMQVAKYDEHSNANVFGPTAKL